MSKFKCNLCNQEFPSKFNLDRHVKNNVCAPIKIKTTNSVIGINPALQTHISKFINVFQEEIFKFEKTDTYGKNKDQLIEFLCEQVADMVDNYIDGQTQDEMQKQKAIEREVQKKTCIETAPQTYLANKKKLKELENQIKECEQNIRIINWVGQLNKETLNKLNKEFKYVHLYIDLDEENESDNEFMLEIADLTMENLDKFHRLSGGKTIKWLEEEFAREQNKCNIKIFGVAKVYINRRFRDRFDFSKNEAYYTKLIEQQKTMISTIEKENMHLEMSYATYTGKVLQEISDPEYQEQLKKEEEHDRRVAEYKQANGASANSNNYYSDSD